MDRKVISLQDAKLFDGDNSPNGSFTGYGSVFGNVDRVGEIVAPGAFKNVDAWLKGGFIANNHDWSTAIAYPTSASQDDYGLKFEAAYHSTAHAQDARTIINERKAAGKDIGLSIGYTVNDAEDTDQGRVLKDLTLYEVSFVTVPANPLAGVTSAKGAPLAGAPLDDHAEQVLAEAKGLVARLQGLQELRAKDHRTISAARRADLAELKGLVEALYALTAPKADPHAARAHLARILLGG